MPLNSSKRGAYLLISAITALAYLIEYLVPALGSSISALVIGMVAGYYLTPPTHAKKISSNLLKYGIILLGFGLSFAKLQSVGLKVYLVLIPIVLGAFIISYLAGNWLKIPTKSRLLIGIGTAICGGSAIAAASPIIEAEDNEIAFSITTIFIYNMLALFIFPILGFTLGYNDTTFGLFAGSAINDTSSVVAAGFAFSDAAGTLATIVKMARTLLIVPACIALIYTRYLHTKQHDATAKLDLHQIKKIFPTFILWFLVAVFITSVVPLGSDILHWLKLGARITMTAALAGVGLSVDLRQLRTAGVQSLLLGGITWSAVILISIVCIHLFY